MRTASEADAMLELKRRGWSTRRIAAELGAERKTVRRYLRAGRWPGYKPRGRKQGLLSQAHIDSQTATTQQQEGPAQPDPQDTAKPHAQADALQWRWMHRVMQGLLSRDEIVSSTGEMDELSELLRRVHECRLPERNKAVAILASRCRISSRIVCEFLGIDRKSYSRYRVTFEQGGTAALFTRQAHYIHKADDPRMKQAVFALLHEPPASHGINRTTWKMADLEM